MLTKQLNDASVGNAPLAHHAAAILQPGNVAGQPGRDEWNALLTEFTPISLNQMSGVALLNRMESKFMLHADLLSSMLTELADQYHVFEIRGQRISRYQTLYFDTEDFALYRSHHAGLRNRYKVRSRAYVESEDMFLEIKQKTHKQRTIKHRVQTPRLLTWLDDRNAELLHSALPYSPAELHPALWNHYNRITLVSRSQAERVTLDLDLRFRWQASSLALPGCAVAEVKRARSAQPSFFIELMRKHHLRSTGFSKYCVGMSLLSPEVKYNNFKAKHRQIAKLIGGKPDVTN